MRGFDDIATTAFMFSAALVGSTRLLLEGYGSTVTIRKLRGQVETLCLSYLQREARPVKLRALNGAAHSAATAARAQP